MLYQVDAPAKVNLHLEIGPKKDNGYHQLCSLCTKVDLYDHLSIELVREGYELTGPGTELFNFHQDILYKAMRLYQKLTGFNFGLKLHLHKSIPMCAGLGGGSSDAGALLQCLNTHFDEPILWEVLAKESASVGADIPMFVYRDSTVWLEGIGEKITSITPKSFNMLLCFPHLGISTVKAYQYLDDHNKLLLKLNYREAVAMWDLPPAQWYFSNSFADNLYNVYPFIPECLKFLQSFSPDYVQMSGSGSTMVVVASQEKLEKISRSNFKSFFRSCLQVKTLVD